MRYLILSLILFALPAQAQNIEPEADLPYDRSVFGNWEDYDGDCQNTRHEFLIQHSRTPVTLSSDGCRVLSGEWTDFYTGETITDATQIDIDHIVPLKEVWNSGAIEWQDSTRRFFMNSWENLAITDLSINRSKRDSEPHEWNRQNLISCKFLNAWRNAKEKWVLTFDQAEWDYLQSGLENCY